MPIPPESIEVAKCYLATSMHGVRLRKVLQLTADGHVMYEQHTQRVGWRTIVEERSAFAATTVREVSCDWSLEGTGEAGPSRDGLFGKP